jgi:peptidoglycan hydrolase CwlO-like protein
MKKKLFFIFLILLTIINLSAFGTLIYNNIFKRDSSLVEEDKCINNLRDSLKLSEKQYCEMKECQCKFKDKIEALTNEIRRMKIELIKDLKEQNPSDQKVKSLLIKIDSLQSLHLKETADNLLKHGQIMNDKQRNRFFSLILEEYTQQCDSICLNHINKKQ